MEDLDAEVAGTHPVDEVAGPDRRGVVLLHVPDANPLVGIGPQAGEAGLEPVELGVRQRQRLLHQNAHPGADQGQGVIDVAAAGGEDRDIDVDASLLDGPDQGPDVAEAVLGGHPVELGVARQAGGGELDEGLDGDEPVVAAQDGQVHGLGDAAQADQRGAYRGGAHGIHLRRMSRLRTWSDTARSTSRRSRRTTSCSTTRYPS